MMLFWCLKHDGILVDVRYCHISKSSNYVNTEILISCKTKQINNLAAQSEHINSLVIYRHIVKVSSHLNH